MRPHRTTGLQRAMVLASLRQKTSYHQQLVINFRQPLDPSAFRRAIELCFARHASIMAGFEFRGSELLQNRISAAKIVTIELDSSNCHVTPREYLENFLATDASNPLPIHPDQAAWRSILLRLPEKQMAWIWSHHHALCDAASYPLLLGELFATYEKLSIGEEPKSGEASPDFLDHLAWLEGQDWTRHQKTWATRISANEAPTLLPNIRRGSPASTGDRGLKRVVVRIPAHLQSALKSLSGELRKAPTTLLLAATALWLSRVQDENTIILGVMRSARKSSIPGAESIIGLFANTVPLRIQIPEGASVRVWLQQLQDDWRELRLIEQCSLAQIMEWTGFAMRSSRLPMVINFQRERLDVQLRRIGLSPARCEAHLIQRTDIPLAITGYEIPQWEIEVVWNADAVDDTVAMTAASGLAAALTGIVQKLAEPVSLIDILSDNDREILERASNSSHIDVNDTIAHDLIDSQIAQQPNAIAMVYRERDVTYRELGELAEHIRIAIERLSEPSQVIALILPPGLEITCSMLGALRAGRPFFIINPRTPTKERNAMLRRVAAGVAIAATDLIAQLQTGVRQVCDFAELIRQSPLNGAIDRRDTKATDLAYLVHTSGSTGDKKFVEVEHRSLANALEQLKKLYALKTDDRRLARASPGTDYFISEILVTLAGGATLVFPDDPGALSLSRFLAEIRRQRITIIGIPASYWHEWVRAMTDTTQLPPTLKLVITGMEKINPHALLKWRRIVGKKVRWLNVYGPAETTLIATAYELDSEGGENERDVPIGKPLPNTRVYVLDRALRQVPVGITGELCISGLGVARGYRGEEGATAQKFVNNPFDNRPGFTRLYRTGDYGYIDETSRFIFSSRRDLQVKIRGYRVELGEIEAVLERHENVQEAIVTLDQNSEERRLSAHLTLHRPIDISPLREWLKQQLPHPFQPAHFIIHDRFPLLPSGKVDRLKLAAAYPSGLQPTHLENKNVSSDQRTLTRLWREALGINVHFDPTDNFFDVGGDSLSAVRLLCLIQETFNQEISIHDLLTNPTIAALSRVLESERNKPKYISVIPLNGGGSGTPLFIVHGWSGGVFHTLDFARSLQGARPVYGVQAVELAGRQRHESFEEMANHYATEIIHQVPAGPIDLLGHSVGGMIAYATACELRARRYQVGTLFIIDTIPSNLPLRIYLRFVAPHFGRRLPHHTRTLLQTSPRLWPGYLHGRRQAFRSLLRERRAMVNSPMRSPPPSSNHYYLAGSKFVPRRVRMNVCLFTPDPRPVGVFWKYLTKSNVRVIALQSHHLDAFAPGHLQDFLAAFRQASGEVRPS